MQFIKEEHIHRFSLFHEFTARAQNVKFIILSKSKSIAQAGERASFIKPGLFSTARLELATASLGIFRAHLPDHGRNGSKTDIQKVVPSH